MRILSIAALASVMVVATAVLMAVVLGTTTARADGAWCAEYTRGGGTNCGFYTYGQCQATVSGVGGYCRPNPFFSENYRRSRRRY
jgi:Protein of unknown function (DUF3551)